MYRRNSSLVECTPLDVGQARLLAAANPGPTLVCDVVSDGRLRIVAVDPVLSRVVTGATHPAGPYPGEVIDPHGFGLLGVDLAHVASTGEATTIELPVGEEPRWYELVLTPIIVDGRCAQILVFGADRTADHDVAARQRRAERRFEAMIDHAPGIVVLLDSTARIIRVSPSAEALLQLDTARLIGRQLFELVHPDALQSAAADFGNVLAVPGAAVQMTDLRLIRNGGATLWCEATATNLLGDDDVAAIVLNASDVTDRRMAEHRLATAVTFDEATGLLSRRGLGDHLAVMLADSPFGAVALAVVALDGLTLIDDGMGSEAVGPVLRVAADRLGALLTDTESVAVGVTGPDRITVAFTAGDIDDALSMVATMATAAHGVLRTPVSLAGAEVPLRATIGTAVTLAGEASPRELQHRAELALQRAQTTGPGTTAAYEAAIRRTAQDRLERVTELQRALRTERLRLAYQPVLDLDGTIVGAEALLRWERNGELATPATFLDLAEQTGLIVPIGAWVLDRACADASVLRRTVPSLQWVSVNVSGQQLRDERFPMLVQQAIADHGLDTGVLALEVDDGDATDRDPNHLAATIAALPEVRVMVSTGDLAADQRILGHLDRLPIAALKLDRHVVAQLDVEVDGHHRSLVGATVDLLDELGIDVIAQGVETEAQATHLRELGVGLFQGFHLAPPMDLASLMTRARARLVNAGGQTPKPTSRISTVRTPYPREVGFGV